MVFSDSWAKVCKKHIWSILKMDCFHFETLNIGVLAVSLLQYVEGKWMSQWWHIHRHGQRDTVLLMLSRPVVDDCNIVYSNSWCHGFVNWWTSMICYPMQYDTNLLWILSYEHPAVFIFLSETDYLMQYLNTH